MRGIRRAARSVISKGKNLVKSVAKRALSTVSGKLLGVLDKVLGRLPFGNAIRAFAGAFLGNPMALMALGPLAGVGAFMAAAPGASGLLNVASTVAATQAFQHPDARQNVAEMMAFNHARTFFGF